MHFDSGHVAERRRRACVVAVVVDGGSRHDQVADDLRRVRVQAEEALRYSASAGDEIVDWLKTKNSKILVTTFKPNYLGRTCSSEEEHRPPNHKVLDSIASGLFFLMFTATCSVRF